MHSNDYHLQATGHDQDAGSVRHDQSKEVYVSRDFEGLGFQEKEHDANSSKTPGFPISLLLVGMIYTGAKALQYLSVPVYTIFKNLTIIVIAYGEVLWFGGSVTPMALLSFGLMVLSSVFAAWADIQAAIHGVGHSAEASAAISTLNAGYAWMGMNVFCSASFVLGMRKVIKKMNFKDWDSKWPQRDLCGVSKLTDLSSHVLQQRPQHPRACHLLLDR
jgi:GDP-mannose transporter